MYTVLINPIQSHMKKYHLELINQYDNSIVTVISNVDEGCFREEIWRFENETWIWENGWTVSDMEIGLYDILDRNDANTDNMLNELCKTGTITF